MEYLSHKQKMQSRIENSFGELLSEKSFSKITVTEILEKSNISKPTFYNYYSDIYDLLEKLILSSQNEFYSNYTTFPKGTIGNTERTILYLRSIPWAKNVLTDSNSKDIFKRAISKNIKINIKNYFSDICSSDFDSNFILLGVESMFIETICYYTLHDEKDINNTESHIFNVLEIIKKGLKK